MTSGHTDNLQPDANPAHFPRPYPVGRYAGDDPARLHGRRRGPRSRRARRPHGAHGGKGRIVRRQGRRPAALCRLRDRSRRSGSSPAAASPTVQRRLRPSTRATTSRPSSAPKRRSGAIQGGRETGQAAPPDRLSLHGPAAHPGARCRSGTTPSRHFSPAASRPRTTSEPGSAGHGTKEPTKRTWPRLADRYGDIRPGAALLRPRERLRVLQGLRVADLRHGRGRPRRVASRGLVAGEVRLRGVPPPPGSHAHGDRVPGSHPRVLPGLPREHQDRVSTASWPDRRSCAPSSSWRSSTPVSSACPSARCRRSSWSSRPDSCCAPSTSSSPTPSELTGSSTGTSRTRCCAVRPRVLLTNLWQASRLQPLTYGSRPRSPASPWTRNSTRSTSGDVRRRESGCSARSTEGVRYFTHYVPSPKSRLRAFLDAQQCVERDHGLIRSRWSSPQPGATPAPRETASAPAPPGRGDDGSTVEIAFVNNMPDSAFEATERQFIGLLEQRGLQRSMTRRWSSTATGFPAFPALRRSSSASRTTTGRSRTSIARRPDGLIVTGTEPRADDLRNEPYWEPLAELITWAEQVDCVRGRLVPVGARGRAVVRRHRAPVRCPRSAPASSCKRSGNDHPLTDGLGGLVAIPHSRLNDLPAERLACLRLRQSDRVARSSPGPWP